MNRKFKRIFIFVGVICLKWCYVVMELNRCVRTINSNLFINTSMAVAPAKFVQGKHPNLKESFGQNFGKS